jgi:hypothetical protein
MPLDVTVVVQNSGGVSEYYYSQALLALFLVTKIATRSFSLPVLVFLYAPFAAMDVSSSFLAVW